MALSKEKHNERKQNDLLEFDPRFGDLSPIEEFHGPRTPSRRQVLRRFLHEVSGGNSLIDAGNQVVKNLLEKHPTIVGQTKSSKRLREDVIALYNLI